MMRTNNGYVGGKNMMKSYMKIGMIASVALIAIVLLAGMVSSASIRVIDASASGSLDTSNIDGAEVDSSYNGSSPSNSNSVTNPNLSVTKIDIMNTPKKGENVYINAYIKNFGEDTPTYIETQAFAVSQISTTSNGTKKFTSTSYSKGLKSGETFVHKTFYEFQNDHVVTVTADPLGKISEVSETDNVKTAFVQDGVADTERDFYFKSVSVPSKGYLNSEIKIIAYIGTNVDYKSLPINAYIDGKVLEGGKDYTLDVYAPSNGPWPYDPNDLHQGTPQIDISGQIQISPNAPHVTNMSAISQIKDFSEMENLPYAYAGDIPKMEAPNKVAMTVKLKYDSIYSSLNNKLQPGEHTIKLSIDPLGNIPETNKANNSISAKIMVEEAPKEDNGEDDEPQNKAPAANAGADITAKVDESITLSGAGTDSDGSIAKYEWDFRSDGIYDWSSSVAGTTTTMYGATGVYTATLRITDNKGATATDTVKITIIAGSTGGGTGGSGGGGSGTWSWDYSNMDNSGTPNESENGSSGPVMTITPGAEYIECYNDAECGEGYVCAYNTCQPVLPSVTAEETTTPTEETETAAAGPLTGLFLAANSDVGMGLLVLLLIATGGIAFYLVGRFMTSEKGSKDYRKEKEPFIAALAAIVLPAVTFAISGASTAYLLLIAEAAALAIFFVKYETQYGYMLSKDAFRLQKLKELVTETKADKKSE